MMGHDAVQILTSPKLLRNPLEETSTGGRLAGVSDNMMFFSFFLSALAIIGFISVAREKITLAEMAVPFSLGLTALWPWETFRFVLPLLPFLIFYFLMGCRVIYGLPQRLRRVSPSRAPWIAVGVVVACLAAAGIYDNLQYLAKRYGGSSAGPQWLNIFGEAEAMCRWMDKELPQNSVIATQNPPLVYLYTGRKTIGHDDPAGNWENWKRLGADYLARLSVYNVGIDPAESRYRTIYRSRSNSNFRVIDLGPPSSRLPWGAPSVSGSMMLQSVK